MKSHNISKGGLAAIVVGGAALLSVPNVLVEKIQAAGTVTKETVCVVQGLTGGMVTVVQGCDTAPAAKSSGSSSVTGGD